MVVYIRAVTELKEAKEIFPSTLRGSFFIRGYRKQILIWAPDGYCACSDAEGRVGES